MENKELEKELMNLIEPKESAISMAEQMKNKKKYEKQVDSLCIESERSIRESNFDEALFKLIEAYKIVLEHPWVIKQSQIYDLIQNTQNKRKNYIKKEKLKLLHQKEKLIEEQKQQELVQSHQRKLEKQRQEKETKLKQIQHLKHKEEEVSNKAFKLLEEGQIHLKNQQFDELIEKYNAAKNLFLQIKWNGEAKKIEDSIQDFNKQKNFLIQKQEKEKILHEEQKKEWKEKEQQIHKEQHTEDPKLEEEKRRKLLQSQSRKELENQVYNKLDEAAVFEKSGNIVKAVQLFEHAKEIMERLGWKQEVSKLNDSIEVLKNKLKTQEENQKREQLSRQIKEQEEQELQKKIKEQNEELQKQESEKQGKLREIEEKKEHERITSEKAFQQIEDIEKEVKYYKEHAKIDKFTIDCPYMRAKEIYESSQSLLLSIRWKGEADKLKAAISMYEKLFKDDLKERAIYNKRREKEIADQKAIDESVRLQKEEIEKTERERKAKLRARDQKKAQVSEIGEKAFNQIEEIEKKVKYYKEHAITENYQLDSPFLQARDVYKNSRDLLLSIGWKGEADKLESSIHMYENLHLQDQKERATLLLRSKTEEREEQRIEEAIRLQNEEREREEQIRLQKLQEQGKKKEYEDQISKRAFARIEEIEKEVKYYKDHVVGDNSLQSPYLRAKDIYNTSREDLLSIGWKGEADKLLASISMYENLFKKEQIDREKIELIKKKQKEEEKELEESIRLQKEEQERREQERLKLLQQQDQKKAQEEALSKVAFQKIEEIENEVKYYKEHVVAEEFKLECPYLRAKQIYESSREQLLSIGWKKEADKLQTSISIYEKLAHNDDKERERFLKRQQKELEEQQKLEESIRLQKEEQEKQERERLRLLREQNKHKQHESDISEEAFRQIEEIEKEVAYYKERVKIESYNLPCPYQRANEVYQNARKLLLEIGWKKEADKLSNSISQYIKLDKEDQEIRANFKKRLEREKQEEFELQETIRKERERLSQEEQKRQSELAQKDLKRKENEELQQVAYQRLEEGNTFIQEKNFENATERLNKALKIFKKIKWKNGVRLTEDAIKYKEKEREKFEKLLQHERLALQEQKRKEREFQEFIEEQRRLKEQEEQNRKLELLRMNMEGKQISEKQEQAFQKLEEGNELVKIREFKKANTLYVETLNIFKEIGWIDGVEKAKEAISHNLLEQERYNQQLELQKKQEKEKEKEERELRELIKQRQELTQLEEEQKRLKFAQQHEVAEKINKLQNKASALLEKGNVMTTQQNFDEADRLFKQAMGIFKEIKWDHGIKLTTEVLKHNTEERRRYEQIKQREEKERKEQIRQQKELEQMLIEQKLMTEQEAQLKQLKQQQESDKLSQIQSLQDEAMKYLEQGNQEISNRNFDQARKLFSISMKIFQGMGWNKGIEMVSNAIDYNEKELVKFNNEKLREEQKKKEAVERQQEINVLIQQSKEEEIKKQVKWKQKLEDKTRRLDEENQIKDQIFALLEKGSKLSARNEFIAAIDLYKKTIPLFEKISWSLKRDQVIDLIDTTQQDYENYRMYLAKEEAMRQRQIQEEEELQTLIASEQLKEKERAKVVQQQQLQQIEKDKRKEGLRKQASDEINKAAVMLERRKFDSALDSLQIALENFEKLGWDKEARTTEEQIEEVQRQKRDTYKPIDREKSATDMQVSEKGYSQIDEADKLIRQKNYKDALPFLEEAKQLFERIQWKKAIKMVEIRIRNTEKLFKEKEELIEKLRARRSRKTEKEAYRLLEKVDKFRRENHYDYALTSAKEAQKIFQDLNWEREANEVIPLIETITKEIGDQKQAHEKDRSIRAEKIKLEEEEDRKIQEIIEERRRRRRAAREQLKED